MAQVDPDMLDRLAQSLEDAAGAIPGLKTQASNLNVSGAVSGLAPLLTWLSDTARDLRTRAKGLRAPDPSPFTSLADFGLPTGLAMTPGAGAKLEPGLQAVLDANKNGDPKARAQAIKDYFATLSPDQQAALAAAEPDVVGNLDGVPLNIRYAANRISIQKEYSVEAEYLKGLPKDSPEFKRTQARVNTLLGFLNPRESKITDPSTGNLVTIEVPRQFLIFDPHFGSVADAKASPFPDGRVAEVLGDLGHANNVAFRVPGITNRLDNFDSFSGGAYNLMMDGKTERSDTAVVSWLGYDTPEIGDSVDPSKAVVGGKALADFRSGISVNLKPDVALNIFAHSYGSLVTSKALQDGMNVNNVVFMGSPGLGPNINSVADFHMPNTHFYAMRAPQDPVSYTQGLGNDPADFKDITRLATDGATGHSKYYNPGTESLANLQRVLFGGSQNLTFTHTTLDQEMLGAAELRELVAFLHDKVPPDVVVKMGGDLDPILQGVMSGRTSMVDALGPLNSVLDKYNMLDYVQPGQLRNEVARLSGDLAYKEAFKAAKDNGESDPVVAVAAESAKLSSEQLVMTVSSPVIAALELDRIQNNARQLVDRVGSDGKNVFVDSVQSAAALTQAGDNVLFDVGDSVNNPTHIIDNAGDALQSVSDAGTTVIDKTGDALNSVADAGETIIDKGTNIADSAIDYINPFD